MLFRSASYVARYMSPKKMMGIDYSKNAIALCNRIHNEKNLGFVEGDASNIPFENKSYDFIINVESSHCYPSIPQFLSEVERVLRPGGVFVWTDICPKKAIEKYEEAFDAFGLKCLESYEITKNVLGALDKETINNTMKMIDRLNDRIEMVEIGRAHV